MHSRRMDGELGRCRTSAGHRDGEQASQLLWRTQEERPECSQLAHSPEPTSGEWRLSGGRGCWIQTYCGKDVCQKLKSRNNLRIFQVNTRQNRNLQNLAHREKAEKWGGNLLQGLETVSCQGRRPLRRSSKRRL